MIRVLHCIETISSGGVEQVRLSLTRGLNRKLFQHRIVCTWAGGAIADALRAEGVELIQVGAFHHPFEIRKHTKVLAVIKAFKPHIIHGAIFEGMAMAAFGGLFGRVPVVILEETSEPTTRSTKAIWLQRFLTRFATKVIGISPAVVEFLITKAKLPSDKVILINNGVSRFEYAEESASQRLRAELGICDSDFIVGSVGRVYNEVKRFSDILTALTKPTTNKNLKFLLVGDGPDLDFLKRTAKNLNISDRVIFVGYKANPNPYYQLMDVFCLPSAHEGFGLVAVEAMLHHLPVIASRVGGLADVVLDGQTGFLIPPFSPLKIADKIQLLVQNPELIKIMGDNGYQRAEEMYTAERYCQEIEDLYLSLLHSKKVIF